MTARPPCRRSAGDTLRFAQELTRSCRTGRSAPPPQPLRPPPQLFSDARGRIVPPYPDDHLARALAWGFLAAPEWSEQALVVGRSGHPRTPTPLAAARRTPGARCLPFGTAGSTVGAGGLPPRGYAVARGGRPCPPAAPTASGAVGGHGSRPDGGAAMAGPGDRRSRRLWRPCWRSRSISSSGPPTSGVCSAGLHRARSTSTAIAGWRGRVPFRDCSSRRPRCCAPCCGVSSTASSAGCPSIRRLTGSSAAGVP